MPLGWLLTALISIASSSAFYTWVWYRPTDFKTLIGRRDPCLVGGVGELVPMRAGLGLGISGLAGEGTGSSPLSGEGCFD